MHVCIEKARKVAGISGLKKNYPENSKQRGCGFWAAFIGSIGNDFARYDEEIKNALRESTKLSIRVTELEHELNRIRGKGVITGVQLLKEKENWSPDKASEVTNMLVG